MKKSTAAVAVEVVTAAALQYGLSRLLAVAASRAEEREERDVAGPWRRVGRAEPDARGPAARRSSWLLGSTQARPSRKDHRRGLSGRTVVSG